MSNRKRKSRAIQEEETSDGLVESNVDEDASTIADTSVATEEDLNPPSLEGLDPSGGDEDGSAVIGAPSDDADVEAMADEEEEQRAQDEKHAQQEAARRLAEEEAGTKKAAKKLTDRSAKRAKVQPETSTTRFTKVVPPASGAAQADVAKAHASKAKASEAVKTGKSQMEEEIGTTAPSDALPDNQTGDQEETGSEEKEKVVLFDPNSVLKKGFAFDRTNGYKPVYWEHFCAWDTDAAGQKSLVSDDLYVEQRRPKAGSRNEKVDSALVKSYRRDAIPRFEQTWNIKVVSPFLHVTKNTGFYPLGTLLNARLDETGKTIWEKGIDHIPHKKNDPSSTYAQGNTTVTGARRKATVANFIPEFKEGVGKVDFKGMLTDAEGFFDFLTLVDNKVLKFTAEISCLKYVDRIRATSQGQNLEAEPIIETAKPAAPGDAAKSGPRSKAVKDRGEKKRSSVMQYFPEVAAGKCPIQLSQKDTTCPLDPAKASVQARQKWQQQNLPAVHAKYLIELEALVKDEARFAGWAGEVELALVDVSHGGDPIFRYTVFALDPNKAKKKKRSEPTPIDGGAYISGKRPTAPPPRPDQPDAENSIDSELDEIKKDLVVHEATDGIKRTAAFTRPLCLSMANVTADTAPKPTEEYLSDDFLRDLWDNGSKTGSYVTPVPMFVVNETTGTFEEVKLLERRLYPGDLAAFVFEANPSYDTGVARNGPKVTDVIVYRQNPNGHRSYRGGLLDCLQVDAKVGMVGAMGLPVANGGSTAIVPFSSKVAMPTADVLKSVFGVQKQAEGQQQPVAPGTADVAAAKN